MEVAKTANVPGVCGGGGSLHQLSAQQAQRTLLHRFSPMIDRMRQKLTDYGMRPYNVFLTWTKWHGGERGEGTETIIRRLPVLPNPSIEDLTGISLQPYSGGVLPVGSVRVSKISMRYAQDLLMGLVLPCDPEASFMSQVHGGPPVDPMMTAIATEEVGEPYEFFYEVVEDGRSNGGRPAVRSRFRPLSAPFRDAANAGWIIVLERVSEDMQRSGSPPRNHVMHHDD
jgi:hypothetical protein